ncbi:MAG TPA: WbqC family protein [Pyrinomonadaceae bacterium]|nr:WbqC family protein [Pyrinomonadaceae bacterium]
MKIAIHQPQYFPWPPYVHKVMSADIFVYLDTVQFSKNGVQNRNQIKTSQGPQWLTVAVRHELGRSILDTQLVSQTATVKHWKTLQANYARTPGFQRWKDELQDLLHQEYLTLDEVAIASTEWMIDKLDLSNKRLRASEIPGTDGRASELVASICEALEGDRYLTGTGALAYLQTEDFKRMGCEVLVQRWNHHFSYRQAHGDFVHGLSTLDLLLNQPDSAAELIRAAGSWEALESV